MNDNLGIGSETLYCGYNEEEVASEADDLTASHITSDVTLAGNKLLDPVPDDEEDVAPTSIGGRANPALSSFNPFSGIQSLFAKLPSEIVSPSKTSEDVSAQN